MAALDRIIGALTDTGNQPKQSAETPGAWYSRCPAHDDHGPSLSVRGIEGQALMYCHAGCATDDVLAALSLGMSDLYDEPRGATYSYTGGRVVHRSPDKRFHQSGNTKGAVELYHLPRVRAAVAAGQPIYVVEGEKDVHALESLGAVATTSPMGASNWTKVDPTPLAGAQVVIVADNDEPGRKYAAAARATLLELGCTVDVVHALVGKDAADHVAAGHGLSDFTPVADLPDVEQSLPVRRLVVTPASQVKLKRVRWLMTRWLVLSGLNLLAGREGLGKSTLAVHIGAQLTTGALEGELRGTPANVLYVATEDDPGYTIAPRFKAAGADMERVFFLSVHTNTTEDANVVLPMDMDALEDVIREQQIKMVVLDAATSVMDSRLDGHDDRKVRQFLEPIAQSAARRDYAVIGICHFGKRDGADTGKLILGSVAWSQVARSVLAVAQNEDSGDLVITNTKKNLAATTSSAAARIVSATVSTEDGDTEVGRIEWLGDTDDDARELLRGAEDGDRTERDDAADWLREYLTAIARPKSAEVKKAGQVAGFSDRTLQRARKTLRVKIADEGFPRVTYWSLPDSGATNDEARAREGGTTVTTGADLHKHEASGDSQDSRASCATRWHDWQDNTPAAPSPPAPIVNLCPECGDPVTGNTRMHVHCAAEWGARVAAKASDHNRSSESELTPLTGSDGIAATTCPIHDKPTWQGICGRCASEAKAS